MSLEISEVQSILKAEREAALGINSGQLSDDRQKALDYYQGDMTNDLPSEMGRSSAVSTDVSDTIEGLMAPLVEIFVAGEEVVKFEPVSKEDEAAAEQETDYVNHVFMQKNPGFLVLYTFIKDALLSKLGIVKVYWDKYERQEQETYVGQPDDVFAALASARDVEIVQHEQRMDEYGMAVHDVVLRTKRTYECAKAEPVPPEEFGISKRARCVADATYCYHEPAGMTQSDLIEQGYDEDQVEDLPGYEESSEATSRDQGASGSDTDTANRAMRPIRLTEHYIRMAYEGDGPGLYRVTTGGDKYEILKKDGKEDIVQVDVIPFAVMTPIIMTHRVFGRSIADLVMDIQKIKSALLRALLDNAYLANNQRVEVAEAFAHERTLDDLLVNRPGGVVRTKQPGGIIPIPNQPIGNFVFPLVEYLDGTREWRTGVTRQGQGIDANALQNQSATAVNQIFTAAQARIKMIARIFAETGVRDLFSLLHATIRKNDRQQNTVKLRNKWVQVDPRQWKTRDDMTINVGLGTGSKEAQIQHLMMVLGIQKEMMMAKAPTINFKRLYNTAAKLVEKVDLKNPDTYFVDPESPEGQKMAAAASQQQPDPEMMKLQAKAAIEDKQAQADIATQNLKVQSEIQLARERFELDKQLKLIDAEIRRRDNEQKSMERQQQQAAQNVFQIQHKVNDVTDPIAEMMGQMAAHMTQMHDQNTKAVSDHITNSHAELMRIAKAPRKRTPVRGKNGRIDHVIDTVEAN